MKSTGMIRPLDREGRIVLPIEMRRLLYIEVKDELEIYSEGDYVVLKRFVKECSLCGNGEELKEVKEKMICRECIENIKSTEN